MQMQPRQTAALDEFIEASKNKGASDEFLATLLNRRGWPADDVYNALGHYWQNVSGVAIPERKGSGESARDAFLYLLSFATLATWTSAFGSIVFDLINHWLPDPVAQDYQSRRGLTLELACLAVAFPIYLLMTRLTVRDARNHPDRLQSGVRKWLTYIALLGTAATMICDLIWFLDNLLSGEITLRFVLKAGTVMTICAAIFAYYLSALKWRTADQSQTKRRNLAFAIFSTACAGLAFCIGLAIAGTPHQQRHLEADNKRIQDLQNIATGMKLWHDRAKTTNANATIPASLNDIPGGATSLIDPETTAPYEYHPRQGTQYELCANFAANYPENSPSVPQFDFWHYNKGKTCFVLDASQPVP